jgi:hypothetical protein
MKQTNKTKGKKDKGKKDKGKKDKNYIIIEKYETNIIGFLTHIYMIHYNTAYKCKNITIKKTKKKIGQLLFKEMGMNYLTQEKIATKKLYKNDKELMTKIKKIIDPTEKYTYCVNKDKLILAETKTQANQSHLKDIMSKHILLCDDSACASGEMIFRNDTLVFDNSSGTYEPSIKNLQVLKKILPFMKIRIMNMDSKIHAAVYKDY